MLYLLVSYLPAPLGLNSKASSFVTGFWDKHQVFWILTNLPDTFQIFRNSKLLLKYVLKELYTA